VQKVQGHCRAKGAGILSCKRCRDTVVQKVQGHCRAKGAGTLSCKSCRDTVVQKVQGHCRAKGAGTLSCKTCRDTVVQKVQGHCRAKRAKCLSLEISASRSTSTSVKFIAHEGRIYSSLFRPPRHSCENYILFNSCVCPHVSARLPLDGVP
jgi:hypothetical protein